MTEWCERCQKDVHPEPEDQGIGFGECWGVPFYDSHMVMICPECEEPLELSYAEWKYERDCDYADHKNDERRDREAEEQWERRES